MTRTRRPAVMRPSGLRPFHKDQKRAATARAYWARRNGTASAATVGDVKQEGEESGAAVAPAPTPVTSKTKGQKRRRASVKKEDVKEEEDEDSTVERASKRRRSGAAAGASGADDDAPDSKDGAFCLASNCGLEGINFRAMPMRRFLPAPELPLVHAPVFHGRDYTDAMLHWVVLASDDSGVRVALANSNNAGNPGATLALNARARLFALSLAPWAASQELPRYVIVELTALPDKQDIESHVYFGMVHPSLWKGHSHMRLLTAPLVMNYDLWSNAVCADIENRALADAEAAESKDKVPYFARYMENLKSQMLEFLSEDPDRTRARPEPGVD